jgi:hypothetical protein
MQVPMPAIWVEAENRAVARSRMQLDTIIRTLRTKGHYLLSCLLALAVIPIFKAAGLHLSVNWQRLIPAYWVGLAAHSILVAVVMAIIGLSSNLTFKPFLSRFTAQKGRLLIFAPFVVWAFWKFGIYLGLIWISIAVVSTELYDRSQGKLLTVARQLGSVVVPALYLFAGLILVFAYNDAIAAMKDIGGYDWLFLKADSYLLDGNTISNWVHVVSPKLSPRAFAFAETMYYRMFDQVGAAILLISAYQGTRRGLRLVGTMLTAYYMALLVFYLWPSMGPFYTCTDHVVHFPHWLKTYDFQRTFIANAKFMSSRYKSMGQVGSDYFIAFPSLHIALTIIVLWFMRRWKVVVLCLIAYDLVLIPAILLLEWHYVIDLLGGVVLAGVAILINHLPEYNSEHRQIRALQRTNVLEIEPAVLA